jgi:tetratricopeptide (TPR) repeat protein
MTESDIQKLLAEASQALDNQQYAAAEDLQRRAIQLLEMQSAEASRVADELEKLAGIHFQQGKFGLAASEYDRVLRTREVSLPHADDQVVRVLYWQGKSYFSDMKYDLAEAAFRRALAASETRPDSRRDLASINPILWCLNHLRGSRLGCQSGVCQPSGGETLAASLGPRQRQELTLS